jgi:hypothetical protein
MSFKTDKLTKLFPDVYGARDRESVLFKLLDTVGAELMEADASVKELLKSHWVRHASGAALDGLGAVFGVERRMMRNGQPEPDAAFRQRLQSVVPFFTGGGTVEAVKGAVRSALGLPFDLDDLGLPPQFAALREDIEELVQLTEFSPVAERVTGNSASAGEDFSEAVLVFDLPSVGESFPHIEWTALNGGARRLRLQRLGPDGSGVQSLPAFLLAAGETLALTADADGRLNASIDTTDVSSAFTNLDDSTPARLPAIPETRSEWQFRARGGEYDLSVFDGANTFGLPEFRVEVSRLRLQRLTFDVLVPFFLQEAVAALARRHGHTGELLVYEGLGIDRIQAVINQMAAAGVRGNLAFSLNFFETHSAAEKFRALGRHRVAEDAAAGESLLVSNVNRLGENQAVGEGFALGGVFDVSRFDQSFGFQ